LTSVTLAPQASKFCAINTLLGLNNQYKTHTNVCQDLSNRNRDRQKC
jgi:hypothetical protein